MKKLTILLMLLLASGMSFGQITSTSSGGNWSDTTTWVGGIVPTENDNVVINGPVKGFAHCKDLKISKTGTLTKSGGEIKGNLMNEGTLDISSTTYFNVYGDIENNGHFYTEILSLKGNLDPHNISGDSLINIKYFKPDSGALIVAGSNIKLKTYLKLYYSTLDMGEYDLYLTNSSINQMFNLVTYFAPSNKILFTTGKLYLEDGSVLNELSITGNVEVNGDDNSINKHVLIWGNVIVNDHLKFDNYYDSDTVSGTFTNLGQVDFGSDQNVLYVFSDVENKGVWNYGAVHLAGTGDQKFSFDSDHIPSGIKITMHVHDAGPYQWYHDGSETGSGDSTLTALAQYTSQQGTYYCDANGIRCHEFIIGQATDELSAAFTADQTSGTMPLAVQFTDQSAGSPTTWSWDFGDGNTSTDKNPSHTYSSAGTYTVSLTVGKGTNTDTETKTDYITVNQQSTGNLLFENFDGETFVPSGWSQTIVNTSNTWQKGNVKDHSFSSIDPSNVYSAICPWVEAGQDEWLISPPVNIPSGASSIQFYAGYSTDFLTYATLKLNISTDGGTNWTKIWEATDDDKPWSWRKIELDLSSYADNQDVKFGWQYVGNNGDIVAIDSVLVKGGLTGIDDEFENKVALKNSPNPFRSQTTLSFVLSKSSAVRIEIYNSLGQIVAVPVSSELNAGTHKIIYKPDNLSTGIYYYRLFVNGNSTTKRMILTR
jgi:PKD repeat protein